MSHEELKSYFDRVLSNAPQDTTDMEAAIRVARTRRRARRASLALSAVLVSVVVGVFVVGAIRESTNTSPSLPVAQSASPSVSSSTASKAADIFGIWKAVELVGRPVEGGPSSKYWPMLEFGRRDDGSTWWGASDGCNQHSGTYEVSERRFSAVAVATTTVGCTSVPYASNTEAITTADQVRLVTVSDANTPKELELLQKGEVLGRYVPWDASSSASPSS